MKRILVLVIVLAAFGLEASPFKLTLWRGETMAVRMSDSVEFKELPEGLTVRTGALQSVPYEADVSSLQIREVYDRLVWGANGPGPIIAEVTAAPGMKAGVYQSGQITIEVIDRVLPPAKDWQYHLDLWQHPWAVARQAGVKPFSKEHYAAMRPLWELLATAGQKSLTVTICDLPWNHQCYDAYHSMVEDDDFRLFDEYVEFGRSCGIGPEISCYSMCPWFLKAQPGTPEFETYWAKFLKRFAAHLKAKGWYEDVVIAMDERAPAQVKAVVDCVHKYAPGLRISLAGCRAPSDFKDVRLDTYCQLMRPAYLSPAFLAEAAERRKAGLKTTYYVCCSPAHPNTFLDSPAGEPFWCGASPAFLGLDGFLRWAWNSWPKDPVRNASFGGWRAGDTFLVYPNAEPSWRFLELRNGIVAAEKVRLLREAGALSEKDFQKIVTMYDVGNACAARTNWAEVRKATLRLVNGK